MVGAKISSGDGGRVCSFARLRLCDFKFVCVVTLTGKRFSCLFVAFVFVTLRENGSSMLSTTIITRSGYRLSS